MVLTSLINYLGRVQFLFVVFLIPFSTFAGNEDNDSIFISYEKELSKKAIEISSIRFNEELADSLSNDLSDYFHEILEMDGAFNYPFDSLLSIGNVQSENGKVRIFTWNIVKNNGTYTYFGLLQVDLKERKEVKTYRLCDKSDSIVNPESMLLSCDKWFGALYYEIIETKLSEGTLYTLLGWDGNDLYTSMKVIESLTFTASGKPKFGKSVFKIDRKKQKRVIFEYSRMANMMIQYDNDLEMIVYDHLSPSDPVYEGNAAYYGPDFSFDGFQFENNVWNHMSNVEYKSTPANTSKKYNKKRKR